MVGRRQVSSTEHVTGHSTAELPDAGLWSQPAQGPMPELPLLTYVILGTWHSLSVPQCTHLYNRENNTYASGVTKIK